MRKVLCSLFVLGALCAPTTYAGEFATTIDMRAKGGTTFYVDAHIAGIGEVELMVDTGSGYMTINETMLNTLQQTGQARFVRQLRGRLANGSELEVPVYALDSVSIGEECWLHGVEAAVFPGNVRPILGLNALQRAAPFIFSFEPPSLALSHCAATMTTELAQATDVARLKD